MFTNQSVYVIGGGNSLRGFDYSFLKNKTTIAINSAYKFVPNPPKLDRLARSTGDLWQIVRELDTKGVGFKVLDQAGMDTTTPTGKLMFNILGSIAEFERDLIDARTEEGRKAAKAKGVQFGRKAKLGDEQMEAV